MGAASTPELREALDRATAGIETPAGPATTPDEAFAAWDTLRPVVITGVADTEALSDRLWNAGVTDNTRHVGGEPSGAVTVLAYLPSDSGVLLAAEGIEATHVLPAGSPAVAVVVEGGEGGVG